MSDASRLLAWYDRVQRDLPWRGIDDPYLTWLSEIMLQQTRVETVVPYFSRFLQAFPDVESLAKADVDDVLGLWSGLGYYRRARQLHAAARQIVALGGEIPSSEAALRELPGIGPYTAAAVASIAFGVVTPVLDGNVERALSRWLAFEDNPRRGSGRAVLVAAAAGLLDPGRPGDSNQALMELGATVCTPRAPLCPSCPLAASCQGLEAGEPERYPLLPKRPKPKRQELVALVVLEGSKVLLFRRPEDSELLAGTWELPWVKAEGASLEASFSERYGGGWKLGDRLGRVRHSITHRALAVEVRSGKREVGESLAERAEAGWFEPDQLDRIPVSSLVGKILRKALFGN